MMTPHHSRKQSIEQLTTFIQQENKIMHDLPKQWHRELLRLFEKLHALIDGQQQQGEELRA